MTIQDLYKIYQQSYKVCTDSREIIANSVFFALKGANFNGNIYAEKAIEQGCSAAVVDEEKYANPAKNIFLFKNGLATLQLLAKHHRLQLKDTTFIGLTGSNGKTTTKELIHATLCEKFKTIATIGNLNNHIGVPLTLLRITPDIEMAVIEMGANHQKEIEFLASLSQPDYGYITNFGKAHLEGFGGFEGVIKGKTELYTHLENHQKKAFINQDDPIQILKSLKLETLSFGEHGKDFKVCLSSENPSVSVSFQGLEMHSNLVGSYNFSNLAAAVSMASYFGVSKEEIKKAIEAYVATNNRSQLIEKEGKLILLDAYNANPTSMEAALVNFSKYENTAVILGDMFEIGESSSQEHFNIAQKALELIKGSIYLIGEDFSKVNLEAKNLFKFEKREDLEAFLKLHKIEKHHILIKGSRGMALEKTLPLI